MMKIFPNNRDKIKQKILGIELLRFILCFLVVMDHLYSEAQKYVYMLCYHIPTFFIISFYFTYNTLISFDIKKTKLRLERLFIPYITWSLISYLINVIYFHLFKKPVLHSFKDCLINLINGHIFNVVLWFQNILILLTLLFLIIIYLFKKFKNLYLHILIILWIIAYLFQYSGLNYYFFNHFFCRNTFSTFGRFAEALPNAITGMLLSKIDKKVKIKKHYKKIIIFSLIILYILTKYHKFDRVKGFRYQGIRLNIAGICIFMIFYSLPFENLKNKLIREILIKITSYTGGIYFIHRLIGCGYLSNYISLIKKRTIKGCIIVYLISYMISFLGSKIFKNNKFKHCFS